MEVERFVPEDGEVFYHICLDGEISKKIFNGLDTYHVAMLHQGNCFPCKEYAEYGREIIRLALIEIAVKKLPEKGKRFTIELTKD